MKIPYQALATHLNQPSLAACYLLQGKEAFLQQDASDLIRRRGKQQGYTETIKITPQTEDDWRQFAQLSCSYSLLPEKRFIELNCVEHLPTKVGQDSLTHHIKQPPPEQILLLKLAVIDATISKQAWYQLLTQKSVLITLWPLALPALVQWLIKRALTHHQFTLTEAAAQQLAASVEGNLHAASTLLEKIACFYAIPLPNDTGAAPSVSSLPTPPAIIDCHEVAPLLSEDSQFNLFDFIESLFDRQIMPCLHRLQRLQQRGTAPALILWAILKELRLMLAMETTTSSTQTSPDGIPQPYSSAAKQQNRRQRFRQQHRLSNCFSYLDHAIAIDQMIKGQRPGNPWEALTLFCLRLCPTG